ncbi:hypothetical protein VNO77_07224 [Canavalia gladiata]|uniref:Uncharacterized protein n=1 Tax=Canavalia gladiata TaxID=3824 RepID=A0AAN9QW18_CANGL
MGGPLIHLHRLTAISLFYTYIRHQNLMEARTHSTAVSTQRGNHLSHAFNDALMSSLFNQACKFSSGRAQIPHPHAWLKALTCMIHGHTPTREGIRRMKKQPSQQSLLAYPMLGGTIEELTEAVATSLLFCMDF